MTTFPAEVTWNFASWTRFSMIRTKRVTAEIAWLFTWLLCVIWPLGLMASSNCVCPAFREVVLGAIKWLLAARSWVRLRWSIWSNLESRPSCSWSHWRTRAWSTKVWRFKWKSHYECEQISLFGCRLWKSIRVGVEFKSALVGIWLVSGGRFITLSFWLEICEFLLNGWLFRKNWGRRQWFSVRKTGLRFSICIPVSDWLISFEHKATPYIGEEFKKSICITRYDWLKLRAYFSSPLTGE